jgi:hypothetical protein
MTLTQTPTITPTSSPLPTNTPTTTPAYGIGGTVRYCGNGLPVPGVVVELKGATTVSAQTDANGQLSFSAIDQANWEVRPRKTGDLGVAVDVRDAVIVMKSTVGDVTLTAQQQLAADVSGDGWVDITDATRILQYAVGTITRFPTAELCGSDWIFVPLPSTPVNQSVTQPQISAGTCRPGSITFAPRSAAAANQDFEAILIGDCSLSWSG